MKFDKNNFLNSSILSIWTKSTRKVLWRLNEKSELLDKIKPLGMALLFLVYTVPSFSNDFYPSNINPASGDVFKPGYVIPITFDVCLGYDFPASAAEWQVEVTILDSNGTVVYNEVVPGFNANGPGCYQGITAPNFSPVDDGTYTLRVQTFYTQEINSENDLVTSTFSVKTVIDLELVSVLYPQSESDIFDGFQLQFRVIIRNNSNIYVGSGNWNLRVLDVDAPLYIFSVTSGIGLQEGQEIEFVAEKIGITMGEKSVKNFQVSILNFKDENLSNNTQYVEFNVNPKPLWPNEFLTQSSGLLKSSSSSLTGEEFIEILTNQPITDPNLCKLTVYDSTGQLVDTVALDQFSTGQTVDSFVVNTYLFAGDVLPDTYGGFALSYNGFPISDFFLSWGGTITAVDGDWKDSTSTDIGIVPQQGNSIALSGSGTDLENYTWELTSTPSPGAFNPNQQIPVELTSFSASLSGSNVTLQWSTATEKNNSGFQVERAAANDYSTLDFVSIGFVKGAGTTTESREYSFIDANTPSAKLKYRLKQIDYNGTYEYSNIIYIDLTSVLTFKLAQNYPNPFNPSTKINYTIPASPKSSPKERTLVQLLVYDVLGKIVTTLVDEEKPAGEYEINFDASELSSGLYLYKLQAGDFIDTKKMLLLK